MSLESEEYRIYSGLLDPIYVHTNASVRLIVLLDHTDLSPAYAYNGHSTLDYVKKHAPLVQADTLDDFQSRNATQGELERAFDLTVPYVLISDEVRSWAMSYSASGERWSEFYAKYPGA